MDITAWPRAIIESATEQLLKQGAPQWWIDGFSAEVLDDRYVVVSEEHHAELAGRDISAWLRNLDKLRKLEGLARVVAVSKAYISTIDTGTLEELALSQEFHLLEREHFDPRVKAGTIRMTGQKVGGDATGKLKKEQGKVTTDEVCKIARTLLEAKKEPRSIVGIIHARLVYSKTHIREILQQEGRYILDVAPRIALLLLAGCCARFRSGRIFG